MIAAVTVGFNCHVDAMESHWEKSLDEGLSLLG